MKNCGNKAIWVHNLLGSFGEKAMEVRCAGCGQPINEDDILNGRVIRYEGKIYCNTCANKLWPSTEAEVVREENAASQAQDVPPKKVCASCGAEFTGSGNLCPACAARRPIICSRCGKHIPITDIQNDKALVTEDGKAFCSGCVELVRPLFEAMHKGAVPSSEPEEESGEDAPVVVPVAEKRAIPVETPEHASSPVIWVVILVVVVFAVIGLASFSGRSSNTTNKSGGNGTGSSSTDGHISTTPPIGPISPPVPPPDEPITQPPSVDEKHLKEMQKRIDELKAQWEPQNHRTILRQLRELAVGEGLEVEMAVKDAGEELKERFANAAAKAFAKASKKVQELIAKERFKDAVGVVENAPEWMKEASDYGERLERLLKEARRLDKAKSAAAKALATADDLLKKGDLTGAKKTLEDALQACENTKYAAKVSERLKDVERRIEEKRRAEFETAWQKLRQRVETGLKRGKFKEAKELIGEFKQNYGAVLSNRKDVAEKLAEYERRCEEGRVVEAAAEILKEAQKAGGKRASRADLQNIWFKFLELKVSVMWNKLSEQVLSRVERYERRLAAIVTAVHKGWIDVAPTYVFVGLKKRKEQDRTILQPQYRVRFVRPPKAKLIRYIVTYRCDKLYTEDKEKKTATLPPLFLVRLPDAKRIETVWADFYFKSEDTKHPRLVKLGVKGDEAFVGCSGFPPQSGPFHLCFDAANIVLSRFDKAGKFVFKKTLNLTALLKRGEVPLWTQVSSTHATGQGSWMTFVLWVRYKGASLPNPRFGAWTSVLSPHNICFWTAPFPTAILFGDDGITVENKIADLKEVLIYYNAPFMARLKNYRIRFRVTLVKGKFGLAMRAHHPFKPVRHLTLNFPSFAPGTTKTFEFIFRGKKIYVVDNGRERKVNAEAISETGTFGFSVKEGGKAIIHWCEIQPER